MLRRSFHRRIPPIVIARLGASFELRTNIIPLTKCTSRSPATPAPYSFQQRQRANISVLKGRLGTVPCQVTHSRVCGERPGGGGYSYAPVCSLRPSPPPPIIRSPT